MKNLVAAALCGALLLAGCVNTSKSNTPKPLIALQRVPEFKLQNVRGGEFNSSQLKGKVVVVDFWATWCAPCKIEIPHYNELRAKVKDRGVEFLGVTYDSGDSLDEILGVMKELKMEYPVVMGTDELDAALGGHVGYPTTFLVGKDWKVYRKIMGSPENKMRDLERDINALLEKTSD